MSKSTPYADFASGSAYMRETEKMNRSMEPYRSIFKMEEIKLVEFDLKTGTLVDLRSKYYQTYVKPDMTTGDINQMVLDYMVGIEWLYQYYIGGKYLEILGWQYNHSQPPLMDDIIKYLEANPKCEDVIMSNLLSFKPNDMTPHEHYLYITPNEYTLAGVSPNLSDVLHLIDGYGAPYLNKCQIKWHEYH